MTPLTCHPDYTPTKTCTTLRTPPFLLSVHRTPLSHGPHRNQCSIFRPWQGWTSLSTTGPNEGTLRVLPLLKLASSYIMLRPFFRPRFAQSASLKFEDWDVDTAGTAFPGSNLAKAQELNELTHPHLRLDRTMVSMPTVEPGDQVYCACLYHCQRWSVC